MSGEALADTVAAELKSMLSTLLTPIVRRLEAVESAHKSYIENSPILFREVEHRMETRIGRAEEKAEQGVAVADDIDSRLIAFVGSVREDINSVAKRLDDRIDAIPAGPKGDPGKRGQDGKDGADGASGKDGRDGTDGQSITGEKGLDGLNGKDGADGQDGREGAPGRDAVHVDVLDAIDAQKRYQRGTFAKYRGGLVRSFKATEPLGDAGELERCGWHIILDGIAEIQADASDDFRKLAIGIRTTSGQLAFVEKSIPVPAYRDTYKRGETYSRGDIVAWDGGSWIASEDDLSGEPGLVKAWRLLSKRGKDGKDK